jgi:hypothetical protein
LSDVSFHWYRTNVNVAPIELMMTGFVLITMYGQIYFHWYKILGLLYKRALFNLQFFHNLFWLKLKWNARSKLFYWYHLSCFDEVQGNWQFCTKDKFKFGVKLISDNFYVFVPERFLFLYFKYWYFRSLNRFWEGKIW